MQQLLTPKQVALATGTSESSIKRWCDKGVISTQYTVGGHRRIALNDLLGFLRDSKHQLVDPTQIGFPSETTALHGNDQARALADALLAGNEASARSIVLSAYMKKSTIGFICDELIAASLVHIGKDWECGTAEIYQERHGCNVVSRIVNELHQWINPVPADAPIALGGAYIGDPYSLASMMVEATLKEQGWNASSLGNNLPFETYLKAIESRKPSLFWLCAKHIEDEEGFVESYMDFYDQVPRDVAVVVGGKGLHEQLRTKIKYSSFCDNFQHLESFVATLKVAS